MTYRIQVFNTEKEAWEDLAAVDDPVRIWSDRHADKIVFETDDPEWNG